MAYTYRTIDDALKAVRKIRDRYVIDSNITNIHSLIKETIIIWDNCQHTSLNWETLKYIKDKYPSNTDYDHIFAKLHIINQLYHANVKEEHLNELTARIAAQALDFQKDTEKNLLCVFEEILSDENKMFCKISVYRSALSKYFALHAPQKFPILDKQVIRFLDWYYGKKVLEKTNLTYPAFINRLDQFMETAKITYNYRALDKFIWLFSMVVEE